MEDRLLSRGQKLSEKEGEQKGEGMETQRRGSDHPNLSQDSELGSHRTSVKPLDKRALPRGQ